MQEQLSDRAFEAIVRDSLRQKFPISHVMVGRIMSHIPRFSFRGTPHCVPTRHLMPFGAFFASL